MNQLLIINGTIINSDSTSKSDIAVSEGVITEIGKLNPADFPDSKIIDAKGKYIFPRRNRSSCPSGITHAGRSIL
jgi:dihydroorotase-like cyclic amidohydrolase